MGATVILMRDPLSPTLMTRLRAKIGGDLIRTVHGVGYSFEPGGTQ